MALGYLVHKRGKGKIWGDDAEVCADSILETDSEVKGDSEVLGSRVSLNSRIIDSHVSNAQIVGSVIVETVVSGQVKISASYVECDFVSGLANISFSRIREKSRIWGRPKIRNSTITDLSVFGTAELQGVCIEGSQGRIGQGFWTRPPRIVRYDDLEFTVTESINDEVYIGCKLYKLEHILKIGDKLGRNCGWSQYQIDRLRSFLEQLRAEPIASFESY